MAARDRYGRLLALLSASTSDIASAEHALADAFERALRTWPAQGVPAKRGAWLFSVARNRLRDHWKSAQAQRAFPLGDQQDSLVHTDELDVDAIPDRRLDLARGAEMSLRPQRPHETATPAANRAPEGLVVEGRALWRTGEAPGLVPAWR